MRSPYTKLLSFFLSASILFASSGVVVASHFCSSKKKGETFLFSQKGCCEKESKSCSVPPTSQEQIKNNCCHVNISYYKIDVSSLVKRTITSVVNFTLCSFGFVIHSTTSVFS